MMFPMKRREWLRAGLAAAGGFSLLPRVRAIPIQAEVKENPFVRLWGNENPSGPPESARRAMQAAVAEGNRYVTPTRDYGALAKLIADRERLTPDHVVLGSGSWEILGLAGAAYGLDGGEIVAPETTFDALVRQARNFGAYIHRAPMTDRQEIDLDGLSRRQTQAVKLVYLCNPNNPTGTFIPPAVLRPFCEDAARRSVVFVDEAYIEFVDPATAPSVVDLVRRDHNVIVSRTFSKIYGMAGMRVGYGLARPDIAARLRQFQSTWINRVGLLGAIAAHQDDAFVAESRRRNTELRAWTRAELAKLGVRSADSEANFLWIEVGEKNRSLPDALAARNVWITGARTPLSSNWARITIGTREEMERFVSAFTRVAALKG